MGEMKLRPRTGNRGALVIVMAITSFAMLCLAAVLFVSGETVKGLMITVFVVLWCFCLSLTTMVQSDKDYEITLSDGTLESLDVLYRGRRVLVDFCRDEKGLFMWCDGENKVGCLHYENGSDMHFADGKRIVNYLEAVLNQYGLLSQHVIVDIDMRMM